MSVDPAQDGDNWWVYVGNRPLRFVDNDGRYKIHVEYLRGGNFSVWAMAEKGDTWSSLMHMFSGKNPKKDHTYNAGDVINMTAHLKEWNPGIYTRLQWQANSKNAGFTSPWMTEKGVPYSAQSRFIQPGAPQCWSTAFNIAGALKSHATMSGLLADFFLQLSFKKVSYDNLQRGSLLVHRESNGSIYHAMVFLGFGKDKEHIIYFDQEGYGGNYNLQNITRNELMKNNFEFWNPK